MDYNYDIEEFSNNLLEEISFLAITEEEFDENQELFKELCFVTFRQSEMEGNHNIKHYARIIENVFILLKRYNYCDK